MPNRLSGETSPYLLQHARNPVDWQPWGPLAISQAKLLDRPIFLSIGYAACHWCHVMERESFEDEAIARILNENFVAIKVDREERPDLDQLYMTAVQAMTGSGGWPMSVFLTPDGKPFYGGTYFPPEPRSGMPAFSQILQAVLHAWHDQRAEVEQAGTRLVQGMLAASRAPTSGEALSPDDLHLAVAALETAFDPRDAGWGRAPKFPQPMTIEFLLRRALAGDERALPMASLTLDRMAAGGMHDQLGGGFHRYSTDGVWLVPHFEQMLYDNAQLARAYLHGWALTGSRGWADVTIGTLDYLLRELTTDEGGFAASQDADTEGEEGATFTWTAAEIRSVLEARDAPGQVGVPVSGPDGVAGPDPSGVFDLFAAAYDVRDGGNWEGRTILRRVRSPEELAAATGLAAGDVEERLAGARRALLDARRKRPQPARDDKVLAAWNGLAIGALAEAARLFAVSGAADLAQRAPAYRAAAIRAAELVTDRLIDADGRLQRSWKDGRASGAAVLEDYADLADGLLALYETTFDERWFVAGRRLADAILERFADPDGGFFDTADDHEELVARPRDSQDNALPSGGAMSSRVLLLISAWTGERHYAEAAERAIVTLAGYLQRYPTAFAAWLSTLDMATSGIDEVVVAGDPADADAAALVAVASRGFRPNQVLAAAATPDASAVPILHGRLRTDGRPAAYLCRGSTCRLPVTHPDELAAILRTGVTPGE